MNRPALPAAHRRPLPAVIRSGSPALGPAQHPKAQLPGFGRRSLSPARKALGFPFSIARDPSGSSFGFALKEPDLPLVPGGQGSWPGSPGSAWTSPPALAEPRVPDHACSGIQIVELCSDDPDLRLDADAGSLSAGTLVCGAGGPQVTGLPSAFAAVGTSGAGIDAARFPMRQSDPDRQVEGRDEPGKVRAVRSNRSPRRVLSQ